MRRRASRSAAYRRAVREAIGHTKASWVRQDRMHLTLHFFGSADAALEARVRETLAGSIAEPPFEVAFDGLGCFSRARISTGSVARGGRGSRAVAAPPACLSSRRSRANGHPAIQSSSHPGALERSRSARESSRNRRYSSVRGTSADRSCYFVRKPPVASGTDLCPSRGSARYRPADRHR